MVEPQGLTDIRSLKENNAQSLRAKWNQRMERRMSGHLQSQRPPHAVLDLSPPQQLLHTWKRCFSLLHVRFHVLIPRWGKFTGSCSEPVTHVHPSCTHAPIEWMKTPSSSFTCHAARAAITSDCASFPNQAVIFQLEAGATTAELLFSLVLCEHPSPSNSFPV
ncbi:hypothetical protein Q9966_009368 [Columba livia]|nr:hypothetical protein Q9966_009368 [Columba livia]